MWPRRSVEKLKRDKYLFKPVPMLYRTWLYHESYRNTRSHNSTSDDSGVIRQILSKDRLETPSHIQSILTVSPN